MEPTIISSTLLFFLNWIHFGNGNAVRDQQRHCFGNQWMPDLILMKRNNPEEMKEATRRERGST